MPTPALPPFDQAPVSHTLPVPDGPAEPDYLSLPDAPAVCIFESAGTPAKTILLATTASARDLARRRFGAAAPDAEQAKSARPDLRALCSGGRVLAIAVGSSLEADAVYLHQARERLPHLAKVVAERWRAWFVHVDPAAEFPQWTKTNLSIGLVGKRSASTAIGGSALPPGLILGPIPDKDAAGRLIESVIDCFDLCREHKLLLQAPNALACPYKEMGRCPAPCDGSETMPRYRERTAEAAAALIRGVAPSIERAEIAMKTAAAEEAFEKAAAIQKAVGRLKLLDKPAFAQVRSLAGWRELLVLPSAHKRLAALALFDRGSLLRIADIDPASDAEITTACRAAESFLELPPAPPAPSTPPAPSVSPSPESIDTIALVARWLFTPKAKRRGEALPLDDGRFPPERVRAIAASLVRSRKTDPDITRQELEGTD